MDVQPGLWLYVHVCRLVYFHEAINVGLQCTALDMEVVCGNRPDQSSILVFDHRQRCVRDNNQHRTLI